MMKHKKLIPAVLGMAMVILLSGCGSDDSTDTPEMTKEPVAQNIETSDIDSGTFIETKTIKITKEELEDFIFAEGFDSPEYYRQIKENIEMLQMNVVSQEVYSEKNVESCNKLQKEIQKTSCKDSFYMSQANEQGDAALCDKVSQKESQKYCKQKLLVQSARKAGDAEICNAITDEYPKEDCKNSVYMETARKTGDATLCEKIENEGFKSMCTQEARFAEDEKKRIEEMKKQEAKQEAEQETEAASETEENIAVPATQDAPEEVSEVPAA